MRFRAGITRLRRALLSSFTSMRVRLTLWYLVILALVFLVFSGILVGEIRRNEEATQHTVLAKIAQQMASAYDPADGLIHVAAQPPEKFISAKSQAVVAPVGFLPAQSVALFVNPQGGVIQAIGPLTTDGATRLQTFLITSASSTAGTTADVSHAAGAYGAVSLQIASSNGSAKGEDYVAYSADVISQGRLIGTLVVATPNVLNQDVQTVIPALLVAGPVTLLVAAIGGYWLASRALRPVRLITRAAQQISETDLSRRLSLSSRDELGELAATFDHMLSRLEAAFQRQRQFTADASHELRTPLTIVNLEVTRALAAPRTEMEYTRALATIQAENQYMSHLVNDLLTLARADAANAPLRQTALDLSDVALEAVERLTPLAQREGVRLVVGALPEITILGDRGALAQALTNLVENGIKYTAGVGSLVTVTTRSINKDGRAWGVARVKDDGPGIAPEHLPHLFDRFYRVDAARATTSATAAEDEATTGSGLGLAIAQWAAQAHGGEARVESAPGDGATFEVWLPALVPAVRDAASADD